MISYGDVKSGEAMVPATKTPKQDANSLPSLITRAAQRLTEARSSAEVLEAKAAAEAALAYAKVTGAANETHADCLRIITRAEIRMASEIDRGQQNGEVAKREANLKQNASEVPASDLGAAKLKDLGVTKQRVSEWRKVAAIGEERVEEAIFGALAENRAPTKADVHRVAGIVKEKPKGFDDQQFEELQQAWNRAVDAVRSRFLAANNLTESNPATGTGGGDVDRSAERASSAVEVGAPVSPERATKQRENVPSQHEVRPGNTSLGIEQQCGTLGVTAGETAAGETGMVLGTGKERPLSVGGDADGDPEARFEPASLHQSDGDAIAAGKGKARLANAAGVEPSPSVPNPETPADHPISRQVTAAPEVAPPTSGATPFFNPRCQHPDTCHFANSREACHDCLMAWAQRPKDEQIRLWTEANEAARSA